MSELRQIELDSLRKHILVDGFDMILDLERSKGSNFIDKRTGDKYLDMASFFASMPFGLNHPLFDNPEVKKDLHLAATNKVANSDFYTEQMIEFVDTFANVAVPKQFKHMFFIEGGALAVENALKASFDWKVRKNLEAGKGELGSQIIHFKQAFHGRSGYTLSLTNTSDPRKYMYFPKFDWPRITPPTIVHPLADNIEEVKRREEESLMQIEQAIADRSDDIAGLIIEPVQAEGGDNHFRPEFFKEIRRLTLENDIMLIYDEVQTGMGLTGKMWYSEYLPDAQPDVFSFGKKSQVCGIVATDRFDEVEKNVFAESSRINSTWGGNIVDMVRSKYYLEIYQKENILDNVNKQGEHLMKRLYELQENSEVSNVRGVGLMAAFDLPTTDKRDRLRNELFKNKLIMLACGDQSIRFRPALNITADELDQAFDIITKSMSVLR